MTQTVRELTVTGRRIGVLAAPGDRRDEDILDLARAAAPAFDLIILREDDNRRGRRRGETGALVRQGLLAAGFPAERISAEIYGETEAVQRSLETAQPGDLLVIFGDKLGRDWDQIVSFGRAPEAATERVPLAPVFRAEEPPLASPASLLEAPVARHAGEHED